MSEKVVERKIFKYGVMLFFMTQYTPDGLPVVGKATMERYLDQRITFPGDQDEERLQFIGADIVQPAEDILVACARGFREERLTHCQEPLLKIDLKATILAGYDALKLLRLEDERRVPSFLSLPTILVFTNNIACSEEKMISSGRGFVGQLQLENPYLISFEQERERLISKVSDDNTVATYYGSFAAMYTLLALESRRFKG